MLVAMAAAGTIACDRAEPPTEADLLVVTADSTFWISSTKGTVRARGVPMFVARVDGRFTELYVADDDRSYYDAVFVGHRLFARDLVRGDSLELHRDSLVMRMADDYAREHAGEQPLTPDEPENDDAAVRATSDLEILAIHGPYLSYEHHTDVDTRDERSAVHRHQYGRGVIDVRTGAMQSLADLVGRAVADSVIAEGSRAWRSARDTLLSATGPVANDPTGRARRALAGFAFDVGSFTIGSDGQSPTIRFGIPAAGVNPDIDPIVLPPRRIGPPSWWPPVAAELPDASGEAGRWAYGGDTLTADVDRLNQGWILTLTVGGVTSSPAVRTSSAIERVVWLDSTVTNADRVALQRAFSEAGEYDGGRQIVRTPRQPLTGSLFTTLAAALTTLHLPIHERIAGSSHRSRVAPRVFGVDDASGREHARPRVRWRDTGHARQDGRSLRDATRAVAVRNGIG